MMSAFCCLKEPRAHFISRLSCSARTVDSLKNMPKDQEDKAWPTKLQITKKRSYYKNLHVFWKSSCLPAASLGQAASESRHHQGVAAPAAVAGSIGTSEAGPFQPVFKPCTFSCQSHEKEHVFALAARVLHRHRVMSVTSRKHR
jgi:hypothetical protein